MRSRRLSFHGLFGSGHFHDFGRCQAAHWCSSDLLKLLKITQLKNKECTRRSLAKASSVLLGPGTYWPHPTEGITRPAALPKPRVAQHSRHFQHRPGPPYGQSRDRDRAYTRTLHEVGDLPSRCPRAIALTYAQHACCKCHQYFNSAAAKLAPPHEPGHASGPRSGSLPGGRGRLPVCSGPVVSVA
jgi:hypothetical protein